MLSDRLQTAAVTEHELLGSSAQATKLPRSCPNLVAHCITSDYAAYRGRSRRETHAHQMERTVSRYWWVPGRNSMKMALSTGKFPPTPMLQIDAKIHSKTYPGEPAAALANMPTMRSVELKETRLPQISLPRPKMTAPKRRPMFWDRGRKGPRK